MATKIIDPRRIQRLRESSESQGDFVLYWMQQSRRAELNPALEFAIQRANELQLPLRVAYVIDPELDASTARQMWFLLEGLTDVRSSLQRRKIRFVVRSGRAVEEIAEMADSAAEVVCDRGYLRDQVNSRSALGTELECCLWQVEGDVIVPVETASEKREYAARTIRRQINEAAESFVEDLTTTPLDHTESDSRDDAEILDDLDGLLQRLDVDFSVPPVDWLSGGTHQARGHLKRFIEDRLDRYTDRSAVIDEPVSFLSAYLHFGNISPVYVYREIQDSDASEDAKEEFLEELLVRRELAINFVHYESQYDSLTALPDWARTTLDEHETDQRPQQYTRDELESGATHDEAWNAMMHQMVQRGYLHNHLRMYWGKKLIEWTNTTQHAYRVAIDLNNKYFLDGCDPNSYANVLWLFGLHDRAHAEREIFGKVRFMSSGGLRRKIDVDRYIESVSQNCP